MTAYELGLAVGSGGLEKDAGLLDILRKLFGRTVAAGAGARGGSRLSRGRRAYTAAERAPVKGSVHKSPLLDIRGIPTRSELRRAIGLGTLGGTATTAGAMGVQELRGY